MPVYDFVLKSRQPLLMHADGLDWSDKLKVWRMDPENKKRSVAGDDRSPGFTWLGYLYSDGEHVAMPQANLASCLRKAGSRVPTGVKQQTLKEASQTELIYESEYFSFAGGNETPQQISIAKLVELEEEPDYAKHLAVVKKLGFKLDARRAVIGQSKHVRVRPRFNVWTVTGRVEVLDANVITRERLQTLFEQAGKIGLGDWRPGGKTPGVYGMFTAEIKLSK